MTTHPTDKRHLQRLRHYGGYATHGQVQQAVDVLITFDPASPPEDVNDVLELHNAVLFVDGGLLPTSISDADRAEVHAKVSPAKKAISLWFTGVTDDNVASRISSVGWDYTEHLLDLLAGRGAFGRCTGEAMLPALDAAGVHPGDMLTSSRLVAAYDHVMRDRLLSDQRYAEPVIRHHLQDDGTKPTHLPTSFTAEDARAVMEAYLDSSDPNPNYVKLVANAALSATGIDARLIVKAQRRYDAQVKELFANSPGVKTGSLVSVSPDQTEPVVVVLNGLDMEVTYSEEWLTSTLDYPSVLNNVQLLFEFAPDDGLLTLPSFRHQRSGFEDSIGLKGATDYRTGHVFDMSDRSTLLQTVMYQRFLSSKDIDFEEVLRWYFEEHVPAEYGISGFQFNPSSPLGNHLERCRNLFAEMESVLTQFGLYVEDGEVDHDIATAGSDQVRYKHVPSLLDGKYAYPTNNADIQFILYALFSDQSHLTWINDEVNGHSAVELFTLHEVAYDALLDWQKTMVDRLIILGVLKNTGARVALNGRDRFHVLKSLNDYEAVSYHHLNDRARAHVDQMVADGWLERRSSLFTEAEGSYLNYYLNTVEFSNGPKIRNKYQHGTQAKGLGEVHHQHTYYLALRTMLAIVIKLNDDLELAHRTKDPTGGSPGVDTDEAATSA